MAPELSTNSPLHLLDGLLHTRGHNWMAHPRLSGASGGRRHEGPPDRTLERMRQSRGSEEGGPRGGPGGGGAEILLGGPCGSTGWTSVAALDSAWGGRWWGDQRGVDLQRRAVLVTLCHPVSGELHPETVNSQKLPGKPQPKPENPW